MQGAYGSLDMAAQANSVQCLSVLSDGWTVGGVVLALLAIRLLLLAVAAAAVMRDCSDAAAVGAAFAAPRWYGIRLDVKKRGCGQN